MLGPFSVFVSAVFVASTAATPFTRAGPPEEPVSAFISVMPNLIHRALYPNNVECKNFDKTGYKTWQLRDRSTVDLGNWDAAFPITGAIEPGIFVSNGWDLFDVLEKKCGGSAKS